MIIIIITASPNTYMHTAATHDGNFWGRISRGSVGCPLFLCAIPLGDDLAASRTDQTGAFEDRLVALSLPR